MPLYSFTSHTFTSCNKKGEYGCTLAECQSAYGGSGEWWHNSNYFNVVQGPSGSTSGLYMGVQKWTVPASGIYRFLVKGASGGYYSGAASQRGYGACLQIDLDLTEGEIIYISCGNEGQRVDADYAANRTAQWRSYGAWWYGCSPWNTNSSSQGGCNNNGFGSGHGAMGHEGSWMDTGVQTWQFKNDDDPCSGGGGTAVTTGALTTPPTSCTTLLAMAGGGGGCGGGNSSNYGNSTRKDGGNGGNPNGEAGVGANGAGGTQTAHGTGSSGDYRGGWGSGGNDREGSGGGGGGGYFGGEGGIRGWYSSGASGGGGGSSFYSTTDSRYVAGTGSYLSSTNAGGGKVTVTLIELSADTTPPQLTNVSIVSNYSTSTLAYAGNIVTLSFTADEPLTSSPTCVLKIGGSSISGSSSVTDTSSGAGTSWACTYTILVSDNLGAVTFTIDATDQADTPNNLVQVTSVTDGTSVSVTSDTTPPQLTNVSIASNNSPSTLAYPGDIVTLSFTADEPLASSPTCILKTGGSSITGSSSVTDTSSGAGTSWTCTYTILSGDTLGVVTFTIDGTDQAATPNNLVQVTSVTDGTSVTLYATPPPLLTIVSIVSNYSTPTFAITGSIITLSFTADNPLASSPTCVLKIGGNSIAGSSSVTDTSSGSGTSWACTYTILAGDSLGAVTFTIDGTDQEVPPNDLLQGTSVTDGTSVSVTSLAGLTGELGTNDIKVSDIREAYNFKNNVIDLGPSVNFSQLRGVEYSEVTNTYITVNEGHQDYTTAGTYSWTCPEHVTKVSVACCGGGGGGMSYGCCGFV